MSHELLVPLLDHLGLHQGSEGGHDALGKQRSHRLTHTPCAPAQSTHIVAECLPVTGRGQNGPGMGGSAASCILPPNMIWGRNKP